MSPPSVPTEMSAAAPACLVVMAGGVRLSIDLAALAEAGPTGPLTPVPGAAPWLIGLAQWHGRLLTVVDAGRLFGRGATQARWLLVLRDVPCETALAVDEILGPVAPDEPSELRIDARLLRAHPAFQPGAAGGHRPPGG